MSEREDDEDNHGDEDGDEDDNEDDDDDADEDDDDDDDEDDDDDNDADDDDAFPDNDEDDDEEYEDSDAYADGSGGADADADGNVDNAVDNIDADNADENDDVNVDETSTSNTGHATEYDCRAVDDSDGMCIIVPGWNGSESKDSAGIGSEQSIMIGNDSHKDLVAPALVLALPELPESQQSITDVNIDNCTLDVSWLRRHAVIHVIHGGDDDMNGCLSAIQSLQELDVGVGACGIVMCNDVLRLQEFVKSVHASHGHAFAKNVVVCVPARVISEAPAAYDALIESGCHLVILLIAIHHVPVGRHLSKLKPYSERSNIVALMLPSCRVSPMHYHAIWSMYRAEWPPSQQPHFHHTPNSQAWIWRVSTCKQEHVPRKLPIRPYLPSTTMRHRQLDLEKRWYWNQVGKSYTQCVPPNTVSIVFAAGSASPLFTANPVIAVDEKRIRYALHASRDEFAGHMLRSSQSGSRSAWWDATLVTASNATVPVWLTLQDVAYSFFGNHDDEVMVTIPCHMQAEHLSAPPNHASSIPDAPW